MNFQNEYHVCLKDICYTYPDGTKALQSINIDILRKSKTGILGPNGAGKSTFIRILNGTLESQGELVINGINYKERPKKELRSIVGIVFQNPDDQLFCPTIFDDVAFGPLNLSLSPEIVEARVKRALTAVGLDGYQKRSSFHLSFGEKKSASIATVIAMNPEIYALDEPSANLDPNHRRKVIQLINNIDTTTLIATHDLDLVLDTCDKILLMNEGKIIAHGGQEILKDKILLEKNNLELPLRYQK